MISNGPVLPPKMGQPDQVQTRCQSDFNTLAHCHRTDASADQACGQPIRLTPQIVANWQVVLLHNSKPKNYSKRKRESFSSTGDKLIAELALDRCESACAEIIRLDLPENCAARLKALGLFEGQCVQLSRRGNPLILKAAGSRIAVAGEIAQQIIVRATDG
ncbi:FeoA family protein [Rhodopirellula halodulae]|uniref:FeoA family protein n=1 Tax=Rhodopirellula halodulae TaxID=2894198 RepID=UPI0028F4544F|nr:FeoA family protein [Rhodopirellula sp. JC737]